MLEKTNLRRHDIVVMTVRPVSTGAGEYELSDKQLFTDYEKELFTARGRDGRKGRQDAWTCWWCPAWIPSTPWCRRPPS